MARDTKCTNCGERFDVSVVCKAFNELYTGKLDYDAQSEKKLCFACACHAAERGLWEIDKASGIPVGCLACGGNFPACANQCIAIG